MFNGYPVDPFFIETACIILIVFGFFSLIGLSWGIISKWEWVGNYLTTECYRQNAKTKALAKAFSDLSPQLREARDQFLKMSEGYEPGGTNITKHRIEAITVDIGIKLESVGLIVPTTNIKQSLRSIVDWWLTYLALLVPLSDLGDLDKAKSISFTEKGKTLAL